MSQEKVDRYKAEKKNRKKHSKKLKRTDLLINLFLVLVAIIIVGFLGWSIYAKFIKEDTPTKQVTNLTAGEIDRIIERNGADDNSSTNDNSNDSANVSEEDNKVTDNAESNEVASDEAPSDEAPSDEAPSDEAPSDEASAEGSDTAE